MQIQPQKITYFQIKSQKQIPMKKSKNHNQQQHKQINKNHKQKSIIHKLIYLNQHPKYNNKKQIIIQTISLIKHNQTNQMPIQPITQIYLLPIKLKAILSVNL